ncbi:hypothetical protein [Effusibacillus consociatus]|uniref:Uncharacterized protein n=1 Tax=Effusibacillus consociatus TaxID=1117041 RepID=A0ABV9Q4J7_9BACL
MDKKKNVLAILSGTLLAVVAFAGYSAYAENNPMAEKLVQLKNEFRIADEELKTIKDPQVSENKGRLLKQKSVEIGQLEKQLNPPTSEQKLKEKIDGAEVDVAMQEQYLKVGMNGKYQYLIEKLQPAHEIIERVKANKEGKTADELLKDIEQVYAIMKAVSKEIPANPNPVPAP